MNTGQWYKYYLHSGAMTMESARGVDWNGRGGGRERWRQRSLPSLFSRFWLCYSEVKWKNLTPFHWRAYISWAHFLIRMGRKLMDSRVIPFLPWAITPKQAPRAAACMPLLNNKGGWEQLTYCPVVLHHPWRVSATCDLALYVCICMFMCGNLLVWLYTCGVHFQKNNGVRTINDVWIRGANII